MPPLATRDQNEVSLAAALTPIFAAQYERATHALSLSTVPYAEFQNDLQATLADELFAVAQAAGGAMIAGFGIAISPAIFDATARNWADGFSRQVAAEVVATSRSMTAAAWSPDDAKRLAGLDLVYRAPTRIESIAITEVTRAISWGEHQVVYFFRSDNHPKLEPIWTCENDADVCEICGDLDGYGRTVYGPEFPFGPPGHPRCRCWIEWVSVGQFASRAA